MMITPSMVFVPIVLFTIRTTADLFAVVVTICLSSAALGPPPPPPTDTASCSGYVGRCAGIASQRHNCWSALLT